MAWGSNSANRWGRKKTRDRGPVTWIDKSGAKPAPFVKKIPAYQAAPDIDEKLAEELQPGVLFVSNWCLGNGAPKAGDSSFLTLERWYWTDSAIVQKGQFLMYSGVVRTDERKSDGRIVNVPRHTFIFGSARYIINDFSIISLV